MVDLDPSLRGEHLSTPRSHVFMLVSKNAQLKYELTRYAGSTDSKIDIARSVEDAQSYAKLASYDLLFWDVDDFDPQQSKGLGSHYVALSANNTPQKRVSELYKGAVLFLDKPFQPVIAPAYITSTLRILDESKPVENIVKAGDVVVDIGRNMVIKNKVVIPLSIQEWKLLVYFAKNQGEVRPTQSIITDLWGRDDHGYLRTRISR